MSYRKRFYLTGSISQPTVEDAFAFVGARLQPGVTRVPDGEPGDRANWVLTQTPHFLDNSTLEVVESDGRRLARLRPGASAADVSFPAFDYQNHAIASYALFRAARERGELAEDSKFLVSIPTPFNAVNFFVEFDSQVRVARAYEKPLKDSVDAIQASSSPSICATATRSSGRRPSWVTRPTRRRRPAAAGTCTRATPR